MASIDCVAQDIFNHDISIMVIICHVNTEVSLLFVWWDEKSHVGLEHGVLDQVQTQEERVPVLLYLFRKSQQRRAERDIG